MKKISKMFMVILLFSLLVTIGGCGKKDFKDPFSKLKNYDNYYKKVYQTIHVDNRPIYSYFEDFVEGDLRYRKSPENYDFYFDNNYRYMHDKTKGVYIRTRIEDWGASSDSGSIEYLDIKNYNHVEGVYYLKPNLLSDDNDFVSYELKKDGNIKKIKKYYVRIDNGEVWYIIEESEYSRFGETFNVKMPDSYITE